MDTTKQRLRGLAVAAALAIATTTATACDPVPRTITWQIKTTHAAVFDLWALDAGLNIYRSPRRALWTVWNVGGGMPAVMNAMYAFGKPPNFKVCFGFGTPCLTGDFVRTKIKGWIYGDPWDLKGALFAAQNKTNCLHLGLIDHGAYIKNWTDKSAGCKIGSVPGFTVGPADDAPMLPMGTPETEGPENVAPLDGGAYEGPPQ